MQVFIGSDYRGFEKKQKLLAHLVERGYNVEDVGPYEYIEGDDFNDAAIAVAKNIRREPSTRGILICDSAHGMTIQANRFRGVRAAHCNSAESAKLAREHDDANVLCMSAHFMDEQAMFETALIFLDTNFESLERRIRRINRLDEEWDYD